MVSIIVPVYKVEPYLERCVDSLRNQTLRDIEIILVDDGSPDKCPQMCDEFAKIDPRIRVIHKKNGGLSSARNAGIEMAHGEWIMFVDSDDMCDPSMAESLLSAALQRNTPMAVCSAFYLYEDKCIPIDRGRETHNIEVLTSHEILNRIWESTYDNNLFVAPWNKLFNRQFFLDILKFREGIIFEDDDLCNRLYRKEFSIAILHKPLYYWRMNPTSITHQPFSERRTIFLVILAERVALFNEMANRKQMVKTAKICCETYIEYYFRAKNQGHPEWITQYKPLYRAMRKVSREMQTTKNKIRYTIFDCYPDLYRFLFVSK